MSVMSTNSIPYPDTNDEFKHLLLNSITDPGISRNLFFEKNSNQANFFLNLIKILKESSKAIIILKIILLGKITLKIPKLIKL
jgi:hypothetical protein